MKIKLIRAKGKPFLLRISFYRKNGSSIKIHVMLGDDIDPVPHSHPWDFTSFLLIPYKEDIYMEKMGKFTKVKTYFHSMFTKVVRDRFLLHQTSLYSMFGIKIPAITIGKYSEKKQLCSLCTELGYCKSSKK